MPQGFGTTSGTQAEVVAAWCVKHSVIPATTTAEYWTVLGDYYLPLSARARLDVTHVVSDASLTSSVRLWDVTAKAPVSGSLVTQSPTEVTRKLGAAVQLTGGRRYQVQAQCTGDSGDGMFAVLPAVTIS